jgi:hypothetical protein
LNRRDRREDAENALELPPLNSIYNRQERQEKNGGVEIAPLNFLAILASLAVHFLF